MTEHLKQTKDIIERQWKEKIEEASKQITETFGERTSVVRKTPKEFLDDLQYIEKQLQTFANLQRLSQEIAKNVQGTKGKRSSSARPKGTGGTDSEGKGSS